MKKNITHKSLHDAVNGTIRDKFIALNKHFRRGERLTINDVSSHVKKLEKQE